MWECISINDINKLQRIQFIYKNNDIKNLQNKYDDEVTRVICNRSENPMFSETFMEKLLLKIKKLEDKRTIC